MKSQAIPELMLDGDGYPTEECLKKLTAWPDVDGALDFMRAHWWAADWGVREQLSEAARAFIRADELEAMFGGPRRYVAMSTGGWSGNESLIRALQANKMVWIFCFVAQRRGGHYIFQYERTPSDKGGSGVCQP